jgi:putative CocE/NonD family hydrolase
MMREPAVPYYTMGDTSDAKAPGNQWRKADDSPSPATDTPYYFAADGNLDPAKPSALTAAYREYTFDPDNPCPTIGGRNLTIARGPKNQNPIETRSDVPLFTTPLLTAPVEVTGRLRAKIYVASSAVDSDLSVRLCDEYPDGKSYLISHGILQLRYHNPLSKPQLLVPGEIVLADVDCWSTSIVFNRGHCLRVTVTPSNYPRFDVNPGTGQPWSDKAKKVPQTNRIYCDAQHPSAMELPLVPVDATKRLLVSTP